MRHLPVLLQGGACGLLALLIAGCPSSDETLPALDPGALSSVLGQTVSNDGSDTGGSDNVTNEPQSATPPDTGNPNSGGAPAAPASPTETNDSFAVSGRVTAAGEYLLFDVGASSAGDEWVVAPTPGMSGTYVVVLLDADQNLLMRTYVASGYVLQHVMREATAKVYLGVMTPNGGSGGEFRLRATRTAGQAIPAPLPQVVLLNFAGGQGISVHGDPPLSFGAMDGALIGSDYAGHTQEIKDAIVTLMRADYAPYHVTIVSSDEGTPSGPHSVMHFGGHSSGLLGLADNVDSYNRALDQQAIVYVESFAPYWTMRLTPAEMGVMIGNVASHELGHLLGLYHTRDPQDVMDTTGSAWDLAGTQEFSRAPLEASVFTIGMENCPNLLQHAVGRVSGDANKSLARQRLAQIPRSKQIARMAASELSGACGTCLRLDE